MHGDHVLRDASHVGGSQPFIALEQQAGSTGQSGCEFSNNNFRVMHSSSWSVHLGTWTDCMIMPIVCNR
jgi:hypothetical protein